MSTPRIFGKQSGLFLCLLSSALSAISAIAAWPGRPDTSRAPEWLLSYAPGVIFAILVLFPLAFKQSYIVLRAIGLLILSTLTYYGAVRIALWRADTHHGIFGVIAAGAFGALVMSLLSPLLLKRKAQVLTTIIALVLGTLGGYVIGFAVYTHYEVSDYVIYSILALGFAIWQCGVGLCIVRESKGHGA